MRKLNRNTRQKPTIWPACAKLILALKAGLLALCLLLPCLMAGCLAKPPEAVPKTIILTPPEGPLQPVQAPEWRGKTNGDLLRYAQALEKALGISEADKANIRAWLAQAKTLAQKAGNGE